MNRTDAQAAASRSNGLKSKGPVTPEGKAISRANAFKHGMAGDGVVMPQEDIVEVQRRAVAMLNEMRPRTEMGRYFVRQLALSTVRVERCGAQELAHIAHRADHAEAAFDETRLADVDYTLSWIGQEPATFARKLRSMPEGVDRMIACLLDLREFLDSDNWTWCEGQKVAHITGNRWLENPPTRIQALSEAINGDFKYLGPDDGANLSKDQRINWARLALGLRIDEEIDMLLGHRETLDFDAIDRDRAMAPLRSSFDPTRAAVLARRYAAAAQREVYKNLYSLEKFEAQGPTPDASETQKAEIILEPPVRLDEQGEVTDEFSGSFSANIPTNLKSAPSRYTYPRPLLPPMPEPTPEDDSDEFSGSFSANIPTNLESAPGRYTFPRPKLPLMPELESPIGK